MYTLIIENHKGEKLQLTQNPNFNITNIDGLSPPTANINTAINANFDGSTYKSSRLNERNIVIELTIEGDVESNRISLYKYIKNKQKCTMYFSNATRNVYIDGYVESFDCNLFEDKERAQISIICPKPYFRDVEEESTGFSSVNAMFEFPFSIAEEGIEFSTLELGKEELIFNAGDVSTGLIIEFAAHGTCQNPTLYNVETGEMIKVNVTLHEGDMLIINTNKGYKSVVQTIDGVQTNVINYLDKASTWLQLESGDNTMLYSADSLPENIQCTVIYSDLYEGV